MQTAVIIGVIILSYLIGSVSSAVIISKTISGKDIREEGSGNAGATNMLRVHGKGAGALTLLIDVLKGVLAVGVAILIRFIFNVQALQTYELLDILIENLPAIAGLFVVIGHDFPVFFKFRGGKGVATSLGVVLMLNWQVGLIVLLGAVIIMIVSRYVSLGSVAAALLYPILLLGYMLGKGKFGIISLIVAILMGALLIFKHKSNIVRLKNGTENKLFSKKKKEE